MARQESAIAPMPSALTPRIPPVSMRGMTEERAPRSLASEMSTT